MAPTTLAPVDVSAVLAHLPADAGVAVVRDGDVTVIAAVPAEVHVARAEDAFALLDAVEREGFWCGVLTYDVGRSVERVRARAVDDLAIPDAVLARFDARLVLRPGMEPELQGDGPSRTLLAQAAWRARRPSEALRASSGVGKFRSSLTRAEHAAAVHKILALLAEGECYQVNLTCRLTAPRPADPVALFGALARSNPAPHASMLTFGPSHPDLMVVSASPELFLALDGRDVETRPIKGTAADPDALCRSSKDRAENLMIVDLARNDLGRVCEFGSVHVPALFEIEQHPGLYHLVSTVRGRLREDVGLASVMHATFPPASVTGAPKPRVMQAIEDLEPVRRGIYCGAIGWIDAEQRRSQWSVAIRTFTITRGKTHLGVGGGIVADSRPDAEWREVQLKAARLLAAASGRATQPLGRRPSFVAGTPGARG